MRLNGLITELLPGQVTWERTNLDDEKRQRFADDWIRFELLDMKFKDDSDLIWTYSEFFKALESKPELAWQLIMEIIEKDPSPFILCNLGAGFLEDLLFERGEEFIDRAEEEARRNRAFQEALRGVWTDDMPLEIQARIRAAVLNPSDRS